MTSRTRQGLAAAGGVQDGGYGTINLYGGSYDVEADRPPSDKSFFRKGDAGPQDYKQAQKVNMCELILVPFFLLVLVLICYLVAGANGQIFILWLMPLVLVGLCAAFVRYNYFLGNTDEVVLGCLALLAVLISTAVGVYGNLAMLQELWRVNQGASYFNTLPSELVPSKLDASSIVFTNSTRVDLSRSFGYVDASSPNVPMYCVAPVTNGEASFTRIRYWAAGLNCCGTQTPFTCGEASNQQAHGALMIPPMLQDTHHREFFKKAIIGAQAEFGLTVGDVDDDKSFLLLDWKADPIGYRDGLWVHAWELFGIFAGVYLVISTMVGFVVLPILRGDST